MQVVDTPQSTKADHGLGQVRNIRDEFIYNRILLTSKKTRCQYTARAVIVPDEPIDQDKTVGEGDHCANYN